jgi:hypothetical protein
MTQDPKGNKVMAQDIKPSNESKSVCKVSIESESLSPPLETINKLF